MFRWGILSNAKIAREQVVPAILMSANGVLHGVASRSKESARSFARQFGAARAYGSYEALLADDEIDGVYIPLPSSMHVDWTLRAAAAGKHVLCEKPIAMQGDDINRLIAARDETGVLISEAFMVYYHPQWQKVAGLIASGAIGRLRHVRGVFTYFNDNAADFRNHADLGGGGLADVGVYPVVTTRIATGQEPVNIQARIEFSETFGTDTYAAAQVEFDGFDLSFYCATQMALHQSMAFHGTKGEITLNAPFNAGDYDFAEVRLANQQRSDVQVFRFAGVNQYVAQVEAFAARAQTGSGRIFTLENSQANQRVIDGIL
ncbi:MAG: Gfo/Idh/MocA family protein, partial [Paracoccaceae bacterium]